MPAFLIEWLAKSALMQSPVGALLKAVPAWAWKALAIIALLVAAFLWHQHAAHKALNAAYAHGKADEAERVKKQALELKAKIDALTGKIATQERAKNEEANRRIAADAGDLRMQGPGRAICSRAKASAPRYGSAPAHRSSSAAPAIASAASSPGQPRRPMTA
jgi:sensor c-di-GMP phosphodiesterase-like protein